MVIMDSNQNYTTNGKQWTLDTHLWVILATIIIIWYLQYHWNRRHLYIHSRNIAGPKGWPLIGNILDFADSSDEIYNTIMKHFTSYPGLTKAWYGPTLVYGVSNPEYCKSVLTNPNALSKMKAVYQFGETWVGSGLLTSPVPMWKRHRKLVLPTLNQKVFNSFVDIFVKQTTILGEHLETMVGKGDFDIFHFIDRSTFQMICETAVGIPVDAQSGDLDFGQWIERVFEITFLRMAIPWYHFDFTFKWSRLYQEMTYFTDKINTFTTKLINEKITRFGTKETTTRTALLDVYFKQWLDGNKLTTKELRDHINTFLIGGSDTTSATISFIFIMLGIHPDIQNRVYNEVTEILGSREMQPEDLPHFNYTERVIKETLRLFPVGPFLLRDITDEIPVKDNFVLPKGSSVILGVMPLHRNADVWPDPLKFDPDRFLPEEVSKRHPFAYLPFSGGPRNCVGPKYAMTALKTMIATLIRKFEFSTSYQNIEDIRLKVLTVLKPQDGFNVSIKLRT